MKNTSKLTTLKLFHKSHGGISSQLQQRQRRVEKCRGQTQGHLTQLDALCKLPKQSCATRMNNSSAATAVAVDAAADQQIELLIQMAAHYHHAACAQTLEGNYLAADSRFARLLGLTTEQIVGKTEAEISAIIAAKKNTGNTNHLPASEDTTEKQPSTDPSPHLIITDHGTQFQVPVTDRNGEIVALVTLIGDKLTELRKSLEERDNQLTVLQSLMDDLLSYTALDPLLQKIAEIMIDYSEATLSLILLIDETEENMTVVAAGGEHARNNLGESRERGVGFAGVAWDTGETMYIVDSDHNSVTRTFWPSGTQLIAVPLKAGNQVIGVCVVGAPSDSSNFSEDTSVVNNLANLASFAIATAQSIDKTKKELRNSRGMREISHQVTSIYETLELLNSVSRTLVESFDFTRSTFFLVNENEELCSDKTWTNTDNVVSAIDTLPPEIIAETSCYWSYQKQESTFIQRKVDDPRESAKIHRIRKKLGIGCSVTMPVIVSGKVIAVLMVCRDLQQRDCDENELNLLSSIVQQLSSAIYGINASEALRHQAYYDSLTELPNRRRFEDFLQATINDHGTEQKTGALLYLDLDGFKTVNDNMGHDSGDTLLQLVARRIERCIQHTDFIARIGGDEFSVILPAVESPQAAFITAQSIRQAIIKPFSVGTSIVNAGTSIGLCFFPTHGTSVDVLLRNADTAMYNAKTSGKNNVVCFEQYMANEIRDKARTESELHDALEREEFLLHFQPQVDPVVGRVTGVEALIRWKHPERGMVPPVEFIPIAEETGLINEIGAWVLKESVHQLSKWKNTRLGNLKVGVNIAASQFLYGDFSARVEDRLKQYNVSPTMLEIELTESVVMNNIKQVADQLRALRQLGVTVALDDFGTGYSSLSYLQDLPLDVLKIDRAFVARLSDKKSDYSIVNTIMLLASGLGLNTVAEGVETSSQLDQIIELGCTVVQGYYYSKPCSLEELERTVISIEEQFGTRKAA